MNIAHVSVGPIRSGVQCRSDPIRCGAMDIFITDGPYPTLPELVDISQPGICLALSRGRWQPGPFRFSLVLFFGLDRLNAHSSSPSYPFYPKVKYRTL